MKILVPPIKEEAREQIVEAVEVTPPETNLSESSTRPWMFPFTWRMEDIVQVISQGSSSQRITDTTVNFPVLQRLQNDMEGDTTRTSATSFAEAKEEGAAAEAEEMSEQLLQELEQGWKDAHDSGVAGRKSPCWGALPGQPFPEHGGAMQHVRSVRERCGAARGAELQRVRSKTDTS